MESNEEADAESLEHHLKELQDEVNPIISKVYRGGKGGDGGRAGEDDQDEDL